MSPSVVAPAHLATVTVTTDGSLAAYAVVDRPGAPRRVVAFGALVAREDFERRLEAAGLRLSRPLPLRDEDGETVEDPNTCMWALLN